MTTSTSNKKVTALSKVPDIDVEFVRSHGPKELRTKSKTDIQEYLVKLYWKNPICAYCNSTKDLKLCSQCCLRFYCDRKCQRQDFKRHKPRCKSGPLGPLETGSMQLLAQPNGEIYLLHTIAHSISHMQDIVTNVPQEDKMNLDRLLEKDTSRLTIMQWVDQSHSLDQPLDQLIYPNHLFMLIFPSVSTLLRILQEKPENKDKCIGYVRYDKKLTAAAFPNLSLLERMTPKTWILGIATSLRLTYPSSRNLKNTLLYMQRFFLDIIKKHESLKARIGTSLSHAAVKMAIESLQNFRTSCHRFTIHLLSITKIWNPYLKIFMGIKGSRKSWINNSPFYLLQPSRLLNEMDGQGVHHVTGQETSNLHDRYYMQNILYFSYYGPALAYILAEKLNHLPW